MANLSDPIQLERYAAQLEEDQAHRDMRAAWQEVKESPFWDVNAEYRYTSLVGYLNACINVTVSIR